MKFDSKTKIYIYQKPIDMRFGFERLSYLIREELGHKIDVGDLFLFLGNNRKRIKGLRFDGSGLILFCKRMEKKRGFMNVLDLEGRIEISHKELELLLHGSVLRKYLVRQANWRQTVGESPMRQGGNHSCLPPSHALHTARCAAKC